MRILRTALLILLLAGIPVAASAPADKNETAAQQAKAAVERAVDFFMEVLTARIDQYWHIGDYENCVRLLRLQMELDPSWVESYDGAGWLLWSMERFEEAEAVYKQGIANNPDNYRLYFELGHMYFRTAKPSIYKKSGEESRQLFEKATEQLYLAVQHPCPPDVNRLLAHTLHILGRYEEERAVLEDVLKKNPTDAIALRDLKRLEEMGK